MSKKLRLWLWGVGALAIIGAALWLGGFWSRTGPGRVLTMEQRAKLLESLQPPASGGPALTEKQRQDLLEGLAPPSAEDAQPQRQLTPEERAELLESLQLR